MSRVYKAYNIILDTQKCVTIKGQMEDGNTALDPKAVSRPPHKSTASIEDCERTTKRILEEAKSKASLIEEETLRRAQSMLEDAKKEAEAIIKKAELEAAEIKSLSRQEGYQKGYEAAKAELTDQYFAHFNKINGIIEDLNERKKQLVDEMEPDIVSLAMEIAEKVLGYNLKRDDKAYEGIIKKALSSIKDTDRAVLHIHSDGEVAASSIKKDPPPNKDWCRDMEVVANSAMKMGDCVLETSWGSIDTGVATQLEQIKKSFDELLDV